MELPAMDPCLPRGEGLVSSQVRGARLRLHGLHPSPPASGVE